MNVRCCSFGLICILMEGKERAFWSVSHLKGKSTLQFCLFSTLALTLICIFWFEIMLSLASFIAYFEQLFLVIDLFCYLGNCLSFFRYCTWLSMIYHFCLQKSLIFPPNLHIFCANFFNRFSRPRCILFFIYFIFFLLHGYEKKGFLFFYILV